MKILLISDLYPLFDDRTIPFVLEDFSNAFVEFNKSICVIRPNFLFNAIIRSRTIGKQKLYKKNGIDIYNRNFFAPFLWEENSFIEQIKSQNFNVIISHMPSGHLYADLINKKLKLPRIAIVHYSDYRIMNEFKYLPFKRRLEKSIKNANLIGARNEFLKREFKADFTLPSFVDKKVILNNKKTVNKKKLKMITLSKLIKRKNIDLVIKALAKALITKEFDFDYDIYGFGEEKKSLNELIYKYELEDKVRIHNYVDHNLIYKKLDENDIFILPSTKETFGISYLEAMARGLITIGTLSEGMEGIIQNNQNGFLIEADVEQIYDCLRWIDISDRDKLIKNTLLKIRDYEKEKIMKKYLKIIEKVL